MRSELWFTFFKKKMKMKKSHKDSVIEEYEKIKNEIISDQVNKIFRDHPDDHIARLEEMGFTYYDDDGDDDELEEQNAEAENQRQRDLVAYFEGEKDLSGSILALYLAEKAEENPNYPLIRRYYRNANRNLKALLLYGLGQHPCRVDLLDDLAFFHEFENILGILIDRYTIACEQTENLETFSELARNFYHATSPDGYEALHALQEMFAIGIDKRKTIDFMIAEDAAAEKDASLPIEF
ncbi:MAG: hypothetical protein B6I22_15020 [Desulfobacteraceae bacterium 4572_123]|nr:MAG: hypothetical protein B6I22_15020 [Desulfobacteraceae bacterium 4572_123]